MEYVKGALVIGDREIMVELPKNWEEAVKSPGFLVCKSFLGEKTAFNTAMVLNVREVDEQVWTNWLTRMQMAKEALEKEAKVSEKK